MFTSELFLLAACLAISTTNSLPLNSIAETTDDHEPSDTLSESLFGAINSNLDGAWEDFKLQYGKDYKSPVDELLRRMIWEENVNKINKHNQEASNGLHTYRMGENNFADMTNVEFREAIGIGRNFIHKTHDNVETFPSVEVSSLPTSVDWRTKGLVTVVVNQEQCGSSPYFSGVGAIEGQHAKSTGKLVSLSVQQVIDCSTAEGNNGCNGGMMDFTFQYVIKNHGIDTTVSYPYEGQDGKCRFRKDTVGATISSFKDVPTGNETAMQIATAQIGPIATAVDASQSSFQLYKDGVYSDPNCTTNPDHGILIVGYGVSQTQGTYWILKNSWGTSWGIDGYIWLARNANNMCGIASEASYPIV